MIINVEEIYKSSVEEFAGNQKRVFINSVLGVYCGISKEGYLRISFMSKNVAPKMESTKLLRVVQGFESQGVYWTCFDLLHNDARKVFFAFCDNLVKAVVDVSDEYGAMQLLKKRYSTWKTMFQHDKEKKISKELLQGLYGELYFLKNYMCRKYNMDIAVHAWSGPDLKSKDFAVDDDWYEIKTAGANAVVVKISSLTQLASSHNGHLVIVKVEGMSDQFEGSDSSVGEIFKYILSELQDDSAKDAFLSKLSNCGFDISDDSFNTKFDVKSVKIYAVKDGFPRLTENDVPHDEICDVTYSLIINSLNPYLEEELNGIN